MANILSRDDILNIKDIQQEEVNVPEWGGSVLVRGMNGTERDDFEGSIVEMKGKKQTVNTANIRAKLLAKTIVDEKGKPLFTAGDIDALGKKSASALQRVFDVAQRLSGMSDEDVEELVKNSENGKNEGSTSI